MSMQDWKPCHAPLSQEARALLAKVMKETPYRMDVKLPRSWKPASTPARVARDNAGPSSKFQVPGSRMTSDNHTHFQNLSLQQLQELLTKTNAAIADRRVEEIKVLADGYAKKLQMNGFSIREGIDALKPYIPARKPS